MGYYILYGFLWVGGLLPLRILYFFSDIYFYLIYYLLKYRRRVVRANLQHAFPEKDLSEIIKIEKRYYRHLCDFFVEMYKMWHMSDEQIRRRCKFTNPEVIRRYFDQGKSDILRRIVENKRNGRLFLAGFIGDQTPNRANLNFWMEFLNQDTPILVGTEKIARKFGLPVISLKMRKVRRGYYEVDFVDVCSDPGQLEPGELTRIHTRLLERYIREVPELWLWSHKRWKHTRNTDGSEK